VRSGERCKTFTPRNRVKAGKSGTGIVVPLQLSIHGS
jgi:hypothetical protein